MSAALPRSSAFKLSYHSAYLILAVRSLEDFNSGRATEDLLSPQPVRHHADGPPPRGHQAHSIALRFAVQILETFLEMSTPLRNEIPIYLHMCISYSALVIAQYWRDTPPPPPSAHTARDGGPAAAAAAAAPPAEAVSELLAALEEWCATCQSAALVTSYSAGLARRRVLSSSVGGGSGEDDRRQTQGHAPPPPRAGGDAAAGSPLYSAAEGLLGLGGGGAVSDGLAGHHVLDMPDLGLDLTPDFPSMEDFFGGGFLDFMR